MKNTIKLEKFTSVTTYKSSLLPNSLQLNSDGCLILNQGLRTPEHELPKPRMATDPESRI